VQIIQARQTVMLGDWVVHEVALVKSLLSSAGPTYTALAVIPLETT
jgi:2'-5' RNA ligase